MIIAGFREDAIVHYVYAGSQQYLLPMVVSLHSLLQVSDSSQTSATLLIDGLNPRISRIVRTFIGDRGAVDLVDLQARRLPVSSNRWPAAAFARLALADYLDADIERAAYLDCDTIVVDDPTTSFGGDFHGRPLAAVHDPFAASLARLSARKRGEAAPSRYFNAGVLVIDVREWRDQQLGRRALDRCRDGLSDQAALNAVVEGRWCELPPRWNVMTAFYLPNKRWAETGREARAAIGIRHYTAMRPWLNASPAKYDSHLFTDLAASLRQLDPLAWQELESLAAR